MDVLCDEQEVLIQRTVSEFLAAECPPSLVRAVEKSDEKYSKQLWTKFAQLGWLGLCLPEERGGQGLPLTYLGLVLEELGRYLAPLPVHSTMVPALVIASFGTQEQQQLLERVASGELLLSFGVEERSGRWSADAIALTGRRDGTDIVLNGSKYFVDNFRLAQKCMVAVRMSGADGGDEGPAAVLVDTASAGIDCVALLAMAKDDESVVRFDGVRIPQNNMVGAPQKGRAVVDALMDYASVFLVSQMQGAARQAMEFAVEYVKHREAFGQPIGAFQAIQHMAADMVNAVDGAQLLGREAIWRMSQGLPARVEISQAKSFANEKCLMVCRSAQQMHGGIGFIAEFDLNLWYRRVTSWSLRAGTTYEHRARIASALLDTPGDLRLGQALHLPVAEPLKMKNTDFERVGIADSD